MAESRVNKKKLEGKVAIVTGGASGIGETTARLFSDQGARMVVIADIQDEQGRNVAESFGSNLASFFHCDVSDEEQVKAMVEWTVRSYGQLDIMVSNAGVLSRSEQTVLDLDLSGLDRLFAVNVRGMAACVKHAGRAMVEGKVRGSIVCTASVAASCGFPQFTDYFMSKHAVVGLVRSASVQLGAYGIRVNSVSPFTVATQMTLQAQGMAPEQAEEVEELFAREYPLKGVVLRTNHVADALLFLASNDSDFISGHNLVVDGGHLAR